MWFCGLIREAQNLSWVSVSPAAQQKSILSPRPPQQSLPWCPICIVSFHISSFILHCLIKCRLTNGWRHFFSFFFSNYTWWWNVRQAAIYWLKRQNPNHHNHTSTLISPGPPPQPPPPHSNSHSNSWAAQVIQVCENTSKMSIKADKKLLTALNQTCFRFQGQRNCNSLNVCFSKGRTNRKN